MADQIKKYMGQWSDDSGKILVLKSAGQELVADFYTNKELLPAERVLLGEEKSPSLRMKTYVDGSFLIVELGNEGLGATLQLEHRNVNGKEVLVPTVLHGLYDDWEEDFGVPWIFPLLLYHKMSI